MGSYWMRIQMTGGLGWLNESKSMISDKVENLLEHSILWYSFPSLNSSQYSLNVLQMYQVLVLGYLCLFLSFSKTTPIPEVAKPSTPKLLKPSEDLHKVALVLEKLNSQNINKSSIKKDINSNIKAWKSSPSKIDPILKHYWYHIPTKSLIFLKKLNESQPNPSIIPLEVQTIVKTKIEKKKCSYIKPQNLTSPQKPKWSFSSLNQGSIWNAKPEVDTKNQKTSATVPPVSPKEQTNQVIMKSGDSPSPNQANLKVNHPPRVQNIQKTIVPLSDIIQQSLNKSAGTALTVEQQFNPDSVYYIGEDGKYQVFE